MPPHVAYKCRRDHDTFGCAFCDGGLFACTVCGGMEGSLTTDCPRVRITPWQADEIYAGRLDYRDGRVWVAPDGTGRSMGDTTIRINASQT